VEFKDYYAALGVDKTASAADIKRAYRKLARESHPDLHPGDKKAEARFKAINEAHEVLGDPATRKKYDELGANWKQYEQAGNPAAGGWGGNFRGAGGAGTGGYRTMTPDEVEAAFGGGGDSFSDFFQQFFGQDFAGATGRGRRSSTRSTRGQDFEQPVDITLEEAFAGTTRRIQKADEERTFDIKIPAGIHDGARIRASGEGGPGHGAPAGDLYLAVRVLPHATFERRGKDLVTQVTVPLVTAVLGGEVSVPTVTGGSIRLRVPELTPEGRTLRLRGHGMPGLGKSPERGDLLATIHVRMPEKLTDQARKHYEALRELGET
jgi:curved DNA-binding protein